MIKPGLLRYFSSIFFFTFMFVLLGSSKMHAQQNQILPDTQVVYTDLNRALGVADRVYKLKLKKKKLREVPPEVFTKFPNLRYLDLSHNSLAEIPSSIANVRLEHLNVSHNDLAGLPAEIGSQTSLKKLILNNNDIGSLPPEIGNCTSLVYIDLWNNELGSMPDEMKQLSGNLKILDLRAILFDIDQQARIRELLPKTRIHFSPGCNCGK